MYRKWTATMIPSLYSIISLRKILYVYKMTVFDILNINTNFILLEVFFRKWKLLSCVTFSLGGWGAEYITLPFLLRHCANFRHLCSFYCDNKIAMNYKYEAKRRVSLPILPSFLDMLKKSERSPFSSSSRYSAFWPKISSDSGQFWALFSQAVELFRWGICSLYLYRTMNSD